MSPRSPAALRPGGAVAAGLLLWLATIGAAGTPLTPVQAVERHAERLRALQVGRSTLTRFVEEVIDLEEVSARLLGPHRSALSPEQRREFSRLFVALLVARASRRAEALAGFTSTCAPEKASVVRCELRYGDEKVRAFFTLRGTRFVDARVGDVALVAENRGAIDRLIRARGVEALLERMRGRLATSQSRDAARRR